MGCKRGWDGCVFSMKKKEKKLSMAIKPQASKIFIFSMHKFRTTVSYELVYRIELVYQIVENRRRIRKNHQRQNL